MAGRTGTKAYDVYFKGKTVETKSKKDIILKTFFGQNVHIERDTKIVVQNDDIIKIGKSLCVRCIIDGDDYYAPMSVIRFIKPNTTQYNLKPIDFELCGIEINGNNFLNIVCEKIDNSFLDVEQKTYLKNILIGVKNTKNCGIDDSVIEKHFGEIVSVLKFCEHNKFDLSKTVIIFPQLNEQAIDCTIIYEGIEYYISDKCDGSTSNVVSTTHIVPVLKKYKFENNVPFQILKIICDNTVKEGVVKALTFLKENNKLTDDELFQLEKINDIQFCNGLFCFHGGYNYDCEVLKRYEKLLITVCNNNYDFSELLKLYLKEKNIIIVCNKYKDGIFSSSIFTGNDNIEGELRTKNTNTKIIGRIGIQFKKFKKVNRESSKIISYQYDDLVEVLIPPTKEELGYGSTINNLFEFE